MLTITKEAFLETPFVTKFLSALFFEMRMTSLAMALLIASLSTSAKRDKKVIRLGTMGDQLPSGLRDVRYRSEHFIIAHHVDGGNLNSRFVFKMLSEQLNVKNLKKI